MKDRIINSYITKFVNDNKLDKKSSKESEIFEAFSTYYVVSKLMDGYFEYDDIDGMLVGDANDTGIDAIGIIINGEFFDSLDALKDFFNNNSNKYGEFTIKIVFIQAKKSSKFSSASIRSFGDGIVDILRSEPKLIQNAQIKEKWSMINEIIQHADLFKSIQGRAYYVTIGTYIEDKNLATAINNVKKSIKSENIFSEFTFLPVDNQKLQEYYRESNIKVKEDINFPNKVTLPEIKGIQQGWYGYLSEIEFLKLIEDENHDLRRSLFFDNVRDFIGDNTDANIDIDRTLKSNEPENMVILNNGITIIAQDVKLISTRLILKNYQIVNGCQTSYVIYNNRDIAKKDIFIPVKIIITTDKKISDKITVANNRQNAVKDEELLALTEFQRKLEEFFKTYDGEKRLYYERRANQYHDSNTVKVKIVSVLTSLRCYSSMFLGIPHIASRWIGRLYKNYSSSVFNEKNSLKAFYTSSFALYKYLFFVRNNVIDKTCRKFKYHILMMIRFYLIDINNIKKDKSKSEINKECEIINKVLWRKDECKNVMLKMVEIIKEVAKEDNKDITGSGLTSNKKFLDDIIKKVIEVKEQNNEGSL